MQIAKICLYLCKVWHKAERKPKKPKPMKNKKMNLEVRVIFNDEANPFDKKIALFSEKEDAIIFSKEKEKQLLENETIDIVNLDSGEYIYQTPCEA